MGESEINAPLQLSLSNSSYTMTILISIAEHGSVDLTPLTLSQTVKLSFFHKSPKQVYSHKVRIVFMK